MKKIITLIMAAILSLGICTACGAGESGVNLEPKDIANALLDKVNFEEELSQLSEDEITYYVTMEEGVTGLMYISSGSTAEEIAVFQAPDKATASKMLSNVKEYLSAQRSSFADYLPEEAKRIDDAVIEQKGSYVVLCVSGQTDVAKTVIEDAFQK